MNRIEKKGHGYEKWEATHVKAFYQKGTAMAKDKAHPHSFGTLLFTFTIWCQVTNTHSPKHPVCMSIKLKGGKHQGTYSTSLLFHSHYPLHLHCFSLAPHSHPLPFQRWFSIITYATQGASAHSALNHPLMYVITRLGMGLADSIVSCPVEMT